LRHVAGDIAPAAASVNDGIGRADKAQRKPTTLFRSTRKPAPATDLYEAIVAQARKPAFYAGLGVPDTVNGRFEMVALHAFLVLRRLKAAAPPVAGVGQAVFDTMFADMDLSLREMGAGDLGVGRRVKAMAEGFYGRISAYDSALASADQEALAEALRRNVYGTLKAPDAASAQAVAALARYVSDSANSLASQDDAELLAGKPRFAGLGESRPVH
jgi:cytochrome b pre-mRNA-processing protein 3